MRQARVLHLLLLALLAVTAGAHLFDDEDSANATVGISVTEASFMELRPSAIPPNLMALMQAASYVAELTVPKAQRANFFASQGNIFDVPDEVMFYGQAAKLPGVRLIGEIGFNAGHSAIAFLYQRHSSTLVSFDMENMGWAAQSLEFVQRIYPNRVERVTGPSQTTVAAFAKSDPRKFDLFAIDGDHGGEAPYQDMLNGRDASRKGAYVLIDDYSSSSPAVVQAWARAKQEGFITEIECVDKGVVVFGCRKAYCLGKYA